MAKQIIKLTESDLHKIVKESVNKILNEVGDTINGYNKLIKLGNRYRDKYGRTTKPEIDNYRINRGKEAVKNKTELGKSIIDFHRRNTKHPDISSLFMKEDLEWDKNGYPTNMPEDVSD